jgi:hypothetical protein
MRVWIDLTNSPHVLVFRPLIRLLRQQGHEVEVTARAYAQTLELLQRHGIEATVLGRHGGRPRTAKARAMAARLLALARFARRRGFHLALSHGSHELALVARSLGIPSATTFDYEFAWLQHQLGCRAATRVVVPEAIPAERLARYGLRPPKLLRYPGLKEEYYLADFEPDPAVLEELGLERARPIVVLRPPPDVSLYHRQANPLFPRTLEALARRPEAQTVCLPRTSEQRAWLRSLRLPSLRVPDRAVDAQSLIAFADLVVSSGGTMNREAVVLGVPVYTTFHGRLGAVDELLIRQGKLRLLQDPAQIELRKRDPALAGRIRRDPAELLRLLLSAVG